MKLTVVSAVFAAVALKTTNAVFPSSVLPLLDATTDPCDDFYQYACGSWISSTMIPDSEGNIDYVFSTITDRNNFVTQAIVKENLPLVGEFWDPCMNMDVLTALGSKPLQKTIVKIATSTTKTALFKVAGEIVQTGPNLFTSFSVSADEKNVNAYALYISASDVTLPDASYYLDDAFPAYEQAYRTYITKILNLAGYDPNAGVKKPDPAYAANTVIRIEKKLAGIASTLDESDDPDFYYNPIKYSSAVAQYPLSFGAFVSGLGFSRNSKLTPSSSVIFHSLTYFAKVEKLVASLELKDLKVYLTFLYTSYNARYVSDDFGQAYFDFFSQALYGIQVRSDRAALCVARETTYFADLIGKYYFTKMFDTKREESTKLMVKLVEDAMGEHIQKLSWLDTATKTEAANKLAKVSNLIGHPLQNKTYPFTLERKGFFENIQKINQNKFAISVEKLGNPVDRTEWEMAASEVNACYEPTKNQIVWGLAATSLQQLEPPSIKLWHHRAIIDHELTHGFDSDGRLYDGGGSRRTSWWTPATSAKFDARAQCLKDQYSNFVVNGEDGSPLGNVDGNLTITEDIADNGGLSLAYDAYQKYMTSPEAVVPAGTNITDAEVNQLFFIAFGQTFCGKTRNAAMEWLLSSDPHSPDQWRINGATMNSDTFAKAFQCKAGSKMNPDTKCVIWQKPYFM